MRQAFAHEALLGLDPGADPRAPGAAVTMALCGHWDHEPPCPLAPHHCQVDRDGDDVRLRVLFAVEPDLERAVRRRIEAALGQGRLTGPDGISSWRLRTSVPSSITAREAEHAERLIRGAGARPV